tara:strand:- start:1821 stop:2216 length:396 start_codon:yes stop_codon:yes gene_type:complete
MKNIFLILVMSILVSCKVTPKDGSYEKIIANDPIVGRASITCLQKPAHHQPVPVRLDKRDRRTQEVTDQYDCMESELKKVAIERAKKSDSIKVDLKEKDNNEITLIKSDKSDDFDLEKLEKLIKKKGQDEE